MQWQRQSQIWLVVFFFIYSLFICLAFEFGVCEMSSFLNVAKQILFLLIIMVWMKILCNLLKTKEKNTVGSIACQMPCACLAHFLIHFYYWWYNIYKVIFILNIQIKWIQYCQWTIWLMNNNSWDLRTLEMWGADTSKLFGSSVFEYMQQYMRVQNDDDWFMIPFVLCNNIGNIFQNEYLMPTHVKRVWKVLNNNCCLMQMCANT